MELTGVERLLEALLGSSTRDDRQLIQLAAEENAAGRLASPPEPPEDPRDRAAWARDRFVQLGGWWYAARHNEGRSHAFRDWLEERAVETLKAAGKDAVPSETSMRRLVVNTSWLPSHVPGLYARAFPVTPEERATKRLEWQLVNAVSEQVDEWLAAGEDDSAERLRRAAVRFFNVWPTDDDQDAAVLRPMARRLLRKRPSR